MRPLTRSAMWDASRQTAPVKIETMQKTVDQVSSILISNTGIHTAEDNYAYNLYAKRPLTMRQLEVYAPSGYNDRLCGAFLHRYGHQEKRFYLQMKWSERCRSAELCARTANTASGLRLRPE
jgi:hypothetical protein